MTGRALLARLLAHEGVNFALTNRIPRRALTLLMARFSRIETPWVRDCSIGLWRRFSDLDLSDARKQRFTSLHDCFTRELRAGARRVDPEPRALVSPCDGILGAHGVVRAGMALQAKDSWYPVEELLGERAAAERFEGGRFLTLRLTATMYHRFHAPQDCVLEGVRHFGGDVWNVNPAALRRVSRLFCRNERARLDCRLDRGGQLIALVPVAAVLVAGIRLHCLPDGLSLRQRGPARLECREALRRGQEMGWFEHGSTIILFVPRGFELCAGLSQGRRVRMGQALLTGP